MSRRLAAPALLVSTLLLAACGGSSPFDLAGDGGVVADAGAADGGARDGGAAADGGARDGGVADGGVRDGGARDGGAAGDGGLACIPSGCVDASGTYGGCIDCGLLGRFGPTRLTITQTGCAFRACIVQDGGAPQCSDGCIDEAGNLDLGLSAQGFTVRCTGIYDDTTSSATLECPLGAGLPTCEGNLAENLQTCQ